jgi:ferrous iron transport protein B
MSSSAEVRPVSLVLAGNPNVGKSVVFNALTGAYVDVSNFPGTTVELARGRMGVHEIVDTPGVYGVSSFNEEERVARDIILTGDIVVNVVDAVHLERDLFLTLQLLDMGKRMVVVLNMSDEARRQGVAIDQARLEEMLGVPVIATAAVKGTGIEELKSALPAARAGHGDPALQDELAGLERHTGLRSHALLVLEGDEEVSARFGLESGAGRDAIYRERRRRVDGICAEVVRETREGVGFAARLSRWMLNPLTGIPMLLGLLYAMWVVLGQWIAGGLVGLLEEDLMLTHWVPFVERAVATFAAPGTWLHTLLAGEFGVLTMTPTYLLGVILPLVGGFYMLLAVLEDSGYLPRIAALADRALGAVGLNGRAVIPLILGLGCVTMGTLTTRILGSKRERFIATALMAIAVPCSAQIAVIAGLMARADAIYAVLYISLLVFVFGAVGAVLNRMVPGQSTGLLIDLPSLRFPRIDNVVRKSAVKVWHFMREVTLFFTAGSLVIGLLQVTGALERIVAAARPLTTGWLGLPAEAATA